MAPMLQVWPEIPVPAKERGSTDTPRLAAAFWEPAIIPVLLSTALGATPVCLKAPLLSTVRSLLATVSRSQVSMCWRRSKRWLVLRDLPVREVLMALWVRSGRRETEVLSGTLDRQGRRGRRGFPALLVDRGRRDQWVLQASRADSDTTYAIQLAFGPDMNV